KSSRYLFSGQSAGTTVAEAVTAAAGAVRWSIADQHSQTAAVRSPFELGASCLQTIVHRFRSIATAVRTQAIDDLLAARQVGLEGVRPRDETVILRRMIAVFHDGHAQLGPRFGAVRQ